MKYSIQKEKLHLHSCSTMFLTTKICSIILLPCLSPCNFESTPCPTICNNKHKIRYADSFLILRYLLLGESWSHTSLKQWVVRQLMPLCQRQGVIRVCRPYKASMLLFCMLWVGSVQHLLEVFFTPLSYLYFVCQQLAGLVPYYVNSLRWFDRCTVSLWLSIHLLFARYELCC